MDIITKNHIKALLYFLQNPLVDVYPQLLAKEIGISRVGALKLLRSLLEEKYVRIKKVGNANTYRLYPKHKHVRTLLKYALQIQIKYSKDKVKMWVDRVEEIKSGYILFLFGSVLHKEKPNDIDILVVTDNPSKLRKEIQMVDTISSVKIHPIIQTNSDFVDNIHNKDPVVLSALQGILVHGSEEYFDILLDLLGEKKVLH
jgi:predicted nucleotidyltransferase